MNYKTQLKENFKLQTGVAYDFHQNNFNDTIPQYFFAIAPSTPKTAFEKNIKNHIAEAYIYSDWEIMDKISLSAGIRSNIPV